MPASPFSREPDADRPSDAPLAIDSGGTGITPFPLGGFARRLVSRIPPAWRPVTGCSVAGVLLGLVLVVALALSHPSPPMKAGVVTDNVVRVHASELGAACAPAAAGGGKLAVSLEIGLDGKVRNAIATGGPAAVRACVESHVKSWEFLPQATSSQMVLPFEIDPR